MHQNNISATINWKKWGLWLTLLFLMAIVSACGGQSQEVAMSEQVPARRGNPEILGEVQDITAEILGISIDKVTEDADFRKDLGATDAQMTELAQVFEEAFTITLTGEEVSGLTTVGAAVELIESKK